MVASLLSSFPCFQGSWLAITESIDEARKMSQDGWLEGGSRFFDNEKKYRNVKGVLASGRNTLRVLNSPRLRLDVHGRIKMIGGKDGWGVEEEEEEEKED